MTQAKLKNLTIKAPIGPGIYIFSARGACLSARRRSAFDWKNSRNRPLYIGKALNLKARLSSYLKYTNSAHSVNTSRNTNAHTQIDPRILQMLSLATDVKTLQAGSEIEALILESQYIKKYKPAFNIMLRDNKNFFYVVFTKEKFPKVFITHQPTFFGPFTDGTALKTTLRHLRRIFPYCTCKQLHHNFCLNYHIGKCPGFCCLKNISYDIKIRRKYIRSIQAIKNILSGKKGSLLRNLEKEMVELGKKEEFEKAIELRDRIEKIKRVFENARIVQNIPYYDISNNYGGDALLELKKFLKLKQLPRRIEGYDVANIQGQHAVGAMVVFILQQSSGQINYKPDKSQYRKFKIRRKNTSDDTVMLKEILTRRFNHPEWPIPELIVIDGGKAQLNTAYSTIKNLQLTTGVIALTKDEKHRGSKIYISERRSASWRMIPLSKLSADVKNLLIRIDSEAHRFAITYYRHGHRKALI
jgi:excinuclease ABC subunit C